METSKSRGPDGGTTTVLYGVLIFRSDSEKRPDPVEGGPTGRAFPENATHKSTRSCRRR